MDPEFFFSFDVAALARAAAALPAHLLLLRGARSSWAPAADVAALAALAARAASRAVEAVPGAGHHPHADAPRETLAALVRFLEGPAAGSFAPGAGGAAARRPERLGLRPLPRFASRAAAARALGPRRVPDAVAIDAALAALRLEEGAAGAAEAAAERVEGRSATALSRDGPDYFGFVG